MRLRGNDTNLAARFMWRARATPMSRWMPSIRCPRWKRAIGISVPVSTSMTRMTRSPALSASGIRRIEQVVSKRRIVPYYNDLRLSQRARQLLEHGGAAPGSPLY